MQGLDWTDYASTPAPRDLLCQFRRSEEWLRDAQINQGRRNNREAFREGLQGWTGHARDFSAHYNVAGLQWKLTGIAREELDRMPEEVRRQVFSRPNPHAVTLGVQMAALAGLIPGVGWGKDVVQ